MQNVIIKLFIHGNDLLTVNSYHNCVHGNVTLVCPGISKRRGRGWMAKFFELQKSMKIRPFC